MNCPICFRVFDTEEALLDHIRRNYTLDTISYWLTKFIISSGNKFRIID